MNNKYDDQNELLNKRDPNYVFCLALVGFPIMGSFFFHNPFDSGNIFNVMFASVNAGYRENHVVMITRIFNYGCRL